MCKSSVERKSRYISSFKFNPFHFVLVLYICFFHFTFSRFLLGIFFLRYYNFLFRHLLEACESPLQYCLLDKTYYFVARSGVILAYW